MLQKFNCISFLSKPPCYDKGNHTFLYMTSFFNNFSALNLDIKSQEMRKFLGKS